ncbi:retrotransposon protein, putative, ty1-copia subclass [Tanacetum coccineum]
MLTHVPGQRAHDRPEVGTNVFKLKLTELLEDLTKNKIFGESRAVVYVIKFQKRGLPHAHILLWLEDHCKCRTPGEIDDIISAELPSPMDDPAGYNCHRLYAARPLWEGCQICSVIFEIDLSDSYTNVSSIYALSNKRSKSNLDSALLWHCRLGHISKKCIEKLQHDGLLNSTNLRAFEKCVPCMSGKMARTPYTHQVERAKDLLRLIHTDVYGPFKIVSRQGASYFVTFSNDFSRYGYVYLLKHKHEVFETFKVFQKEVENQLGKTIKLLRSDHGGEYMSQEFLDHLKDHGIITHRTPPYTP